jgi:hypothetical protein
MSRNLTFPSMTALVTVLGLAVVSGCGNDADEDADEGAIAQNLKHQAACGIDDGTVGKHDEVRACDPANKKKTTICHVPPGNPANAHTLCIGNAAVEAHLRNHPDYLGPCRQENPCPPPVMPPAGTGGAGGTGAPGTGGSGAPGTGGSGEGTGGTGAPATGGAGGTQIVE